jgi:RNA polymerase sigma-70 factor (ECF subfamily)
MPQGYFASPLRFESVDEVLGVTDASEGAFRRHYAEIYRYVRRRTQSEHEAEELTQQVFADAAASLRCDGRPPIAWLYAVAKRRFADAARRESRRPASLEVPGKAAREYGPSVAAALRAAFERLPSSQREVVVLKLVRGAPFAEIAALVGTSEEAARMRFSRALRSIRADLEKEGIEP